MFKIKNKLNFKMFSNKIPSNKKLNKLGKLMLKNNKRNKAKKL